MTSASPHVGELRAQEQAGETAAARRNGRVIANRVPAGAVGFVSRQRQVILGSIDPEGRPWASILFGLSGFATVPDLDRLELDLSRATCRPDDPLWQNLAQDPRLGCLFIELSTRRRLRVNGRAAKTGATLRLAVDEAYPNCPKYIQRRHATALDTAPAGPLPPLRRGVALDEPLRRWIETADTLFVASAHPEQGMDASHRGGNPGFVQVLGERTVRIPDYPGNSLYNTLGNFVLNPVAGLLFFDFDRHATLQITGRVEIQWGLSRPDELGGTGRAWTVSVDQWILGQLPPVFAYELLDHSPFNPGPEVPVR
jgi:hypothetical protein